MTLIGRRREVTLIGRWRELTLIGRRREVTLICRRREVTLIGRRRELTLNGLYTQPHTHSNPLRCTTQGYMQSFLLYHMKDVHTTTWGTILCVCICTH